MTIFGHIFVKFLATFHSQRLVTLTVSMTRTHVSCYDLTIFFDAGGKFQQFLLNGNFRLRLARSLVNVSTRALPRTFVRCLLEWVSEGVCVCGCVCVCVGVCVGVCGCVCERERQ